MTELTNEGCREQALANAKLGNYETAMRWYNTAAARTIGHKKTDSYEQLARNMAEMAGIKCRPGDYAKDSEALDIKYSWQQ
jgi:hypothetical protein